MHNYVKQFLSWYGITEILPQTPISINSISSKCDIRQKHLFKSDDNELWHIQYQ